MSKGRRGWTLLLTDAQRDAEKKGRKRKNSDKERERMEVEARACKWESKAWMKKEIFLFFFFFYFISITITMDTTKLLDGERERDSWLFDVFTSSLRGRAFGISVTFEETVSEQFNMREARSEWFFYPLSLTRATLEVMKREREREREAAILPLLDDNEQLHTSEDSYK